ncbi:uncharacterized protein LOC144887742 [Branchiostoma floridae x Branchiostoma japonicum]
MEKFLSGECHPEGPPAKLGTWATQVEIEAMSLLLGRCIYVYGKHGNDWAWMKYPLRESTCDRMLDGSNALYIQNTNLDHFDVVTTVLRRRQTRSMSRCHREEATEVSQVPSSNSKHTLIDNDDDEDRKRARRDRERNRYHEDPQYAKAQRDRKKTKYHTVHEHAEGERDRKKTKYHTDHEHALEKQDYERDKYHTDPNHRDLKNRNRQINREKNQSLADVERDIEEFQRECKKGPEYVCTVCHRLLFCNQVVICDKDKYVEAVKHCLTGTYVHQCNVECSPHACPTANSSRGQEWICHCCDTHLLKKKTIPYEAQSNKMKLPEIPPELKSLNTLESQLIAKRIPFMKVAALPKGGQKGVLGPVVCVPADVSETHAILPRMPSEAQLIKVKLKRKLQYNAYHMYRQISPLKVDVALKYLVENNEHYSGTSIDADWTLSWNNGEGLVEQSDAEHGGNDDLEVGTTAEHSESVNEEGDDGVGPTGDGVEDDEMDDILRRLQQLNVEEVIKEAGLVNMEEAIEEAGQVNVEEAEHDEGSDDLQVGTTAEHSESVNEEGDDVVGPTGDGVEDDEMDGILLQVDVEEAIEEAALSEEEELDSRLRGLPHDTCLQPVDIGQDFLDHHDERIMCVAPGEGKKPISVFQEVGGEAMSFPVQFPTGKFSFNDDRDVRITPSKYFKARLMGADARFASDTSYIFFAQYVTELHFIQSNISISMRKGSPIASDGREISAGMLSNKEDLQSILKSDQAIAFFSHPVAQQDLTDEESASNAERKKQAESDLKKFWDVLDKNKEPEKCSTDDVLREANLTTAQLCDALNLMATRKQVFLRRQPKDMWIFPEVEQERLECLDKRGENEGNDDDEGTEDDIPDLATTDKSKEKSFAIEACQKQISEEAAIPMMQSLNPMQQRVFYFAEQENKKTGDEQGIAGQEKAEEQQVEGARERLADEQECEVTGEWQGEEFMFNPFTANDQLLLAVYWNQIKPWRSSCLVSVILRALQQSLVRGPRRLK